MSVMMSMHTYLNQIKIIHLLLPTGVGLIQIWNVIDHYMVIDNDIGNVSAEIKWPWGLGFDPELAS